ncbi:MAG: JDVT-CTERM system glutamic-type intramembrane protease MrtJ [Burkholderiales bacterium]
MPNANGARSLADSASSLRPLTSLAGDPQFVAALILGPVAWSLIAWWSNWDVAFDFPPRLLVDQPVRFAMLVIAYPVLEEFVFRGWLQPALSARLKQRLSPGVSAANLMTSTLFALAHLWYHPPAMALATFFPSLVFGHMRDRYNHLLPAIALHAFYNAGYFSIFG